jgi:hypothetical protein
MKHPGEKPWFVEDPCGPFFAIYCERVRRAIDLPDRPMVEWYLCPDNEDKCHERAIAEGCAHTVELAMLQVADAVTAIAGILLAWTKNAPTGAELSNELTKGTP